MSENEDTGQKDGEEGGREDSETHGKKMAMTLHLSLTHTLPLFTPTYTLVYATGMPMRCEQSEHEAMQQFNCSGSLPRQTQTPQRQSVCELCWRRAVKRRLNV